MNYPKKLLSSMLLLSSMFVSAQYNTLSEWSIGLSGGATASNILLVPKMVDKLYSLGKMGGFTLRYVSEEHFGFQLECNYMQTGWKEDYYGTKNWNNFTYSRKITTIEVPFLTRMYVKSNSAHFFINMGPTLSYALSESEDNRSPEVMLQHGKRIEKPLQYGMLGGAGLEFKVGRSIVGLEGRYTYNLSNLFKDDIGNDFVNSNLQIVSLRMHVLMQLTK